MKSKAHVSKDARSRRAEQADRETTAQALAASELRYRRLFESAKDGILILDAETGMVVDANPYLVELLGFSCEEFLGKRIWELGFFKRRRDIPASHQSHGIGTRSTLASIHSSDGNRTGVQGIEA